MVRSRIGILFLLVILSSCDLLNPSRYALTNDLNKDSVLDSLLSGKEILPPSGADYYIEIDGADHIVTLFWEINPSAAGYNVYYAERKDGSFAKMTEKPVGENLYVLPPFSFSEKASEYHRYVKLTSVSESGVESAFSVVLDIAVLKNSSFTGSMNSFSLTRGTSRNIEFSWTPAVDAFRYEIYRKMNGASEEDWQCIDDCFIPYDNTVATIVYKDLTADEGIIYDYGVIAFDRYGASSEFRSVTIGYILPAPYDLEVVGLPTDGFILSDDTQILELTWKINSKIRNAEKEFTLGSDTEPLGSKVFPFPEYSSSGWKPSVLMEPGNPNFKDLYNTVFKPSFTCANDTEHGLELLQEIPETNKTLNPPDGFDEQAGGLFYSKTDASGVVTVKYRVEIEKPGSSSTGEYTYKWKKPVYFKVKAVYEHNDTVRRYETPDSGLFGGYASDPAGPKMTSNLGLQATLSGETVTVTFPPAPDVASSYNVYRRTASDIQYTLVNAEPVVPNGESTITVTDTKEIAGQSFIDYRIEYIDSNNVSSCLSSKVTVTVSE